MKNIFCFIFLVFTSICFGQTDDVTNKEQSSIADQFELLLQKSSSYLKYKVIPLNEYNQLQRNVLDSLQLQQQTIKNQKAAIDSVHQKNDDLSKELATTKNDLKSTTEFKDSRSILGIKMNKFTFSIIIVFTYALLLFLLGLFIFKYKNNLSTTKKAVSNLEELETEFEKHKKESLRRFQEVNRKLHDELNKK